MVKHLFVKIMLKNFFPTGTTGNTGVWNKLYKAELVKITEDIEAMTENCNIEEEKLEEIKQAKENLKARIDDVTTQIESMQNIGFESEKKKEQLNSEINVNKTRI